MAGSNVVLIDADLSSLFPDAESVNRALRALASAAKGVVRRPPREQARERLGYRLTIFRFDADVHDSIRERTTGDRA